MGGEWATGAVLVSETFPPAHRNKAVSIMQSGWAIGYVLAAVLAAAILGSPALGEDAWRWLFVAGVLPALVALWIRRNVREPEAWTRSRRETGVRRNAFAVIFGPALRRRTLLVILLGACVQFAYWGIFFWLPGFLARPLADGGAGMGVVRSLGWIISVQIGAYVGYLTFGFIADRVGRRRTFIAFMLAAALLIVVYGQLAAHPGWLLVLSPVLGYVGHGYFSMFGSFIAELFPTAIRATAQGLAYNAGRLAGALAPFVIGALADVPRRWARSSSSSVGTLEIRAPLHGLTVSPTRSARSDPRHRFCRRISVSRAIRCRRTASARSSRRFACAASAIAIWI
jgi:MFS family permease